MKARLSMAFQDLRGRDGTVVVARTRAGLALRPWVNGQNPKTMPQRGIRSILKFVSKSYEGLDKAVVDVWDDYGRTLVRTDPVTGKTYWLDGGAAYAQLGVKFLQAQPGGTLPLLPPTTDFLGDSITLTATPGTGKITFTASGANALGIRTELLVQRLAAKNRTPQPEGYRSARFFSFTSGTLSVDVTVKPGTYATAYRFVKLATGQATELFPIGTGTVALALALGGSAGKSGKRAA